MYSGTTTTCCSGVIACKWKYHICNSFLISSLLGLQLYIGVASYGSGTGARHFLDLQQSTAQSSGGSRIFLKGSAEC